MQFPQGSKQLKIPLLWPLLTMIGAIVAVLLPIYEHPWIYEIAWFLSWPGYNGWLVLSILFLILPFTRLFPSFKGELSSRFWPVFDVLIFAFLFSQAAKYLLRWPRPSGGRSGAISGHSLCAFGLAWLVSSFYPRWAPYYFMFAASVAWSRVYIEEHYPYQVVLGVLIGSLIGFIGTHFSDGVWCPRFFRRRRKQVVDSAAAEQTQSEAIPN